MLSKNISKFLIVGVLFSIEVYLHFFNLSYGTPNLQKHLQVFKSIQELKSWVPEILKLRDEYYSGIDDLLNPEKPFKQTFNKLFHTDQKISQFSKLPQKFVLERTRGYLIGVFNSDEQNTIRALSRLNPFKLQFNPGLNTFYGGFYYYSCGAFLYLGKILGWISLNPDVEYYFYHPEEIQKMYVLVRSLGGIAVLLTGFLIFYWMNKLYSFRTALFAILFFIFIPLFVPYTHLAKAHNYGMFLFFFGFYFICKILTEPVIKNYTIGSFLLGLSAGSIITNLTVGSIIFLVEWARNNWRLKPVFLNKNFWVACFIFFGVYFLTNYYIFFNFAQFQRSVLALNEYIKSYGESYGGLRLSQWFPFIKDMFTNQFHWSVIPIILFGLITALMRKDLLLKIFAITFILLLLMNLCFTRHPGVNIRVFPLIAALCAIGCQVLLTYFSKFPRYLCLIYIFFTIFFSGAQSYFYFTQFREPSHLDLAGTWINSSLESKETIGVVGGQLTQGSFPPIHFFDYQLIFFPRADQIPAVFSKESLPNYVISNEKNHPLFQNYYEIVQEWNKEDKFLNIPFGTRWVFSSNIDVFIFKKK